MKYVFTGTSISLNEAEKIGGSTCWIRPPIARGEIPKILSSPHRGKILIIDGMFFHTNAVALEEIRSALRAGWEVYGCSSMGVLRALEAKDIGMIGVGAVYRWFRLFNIEDDDELAQVICPDTFKPLTAAMIDIRYFAQVIRIKFKIDRVILDFALNMLKSMPFQQRSIGEFVRCMSNMVPGPLLDSIKNEISRFRGLKERDARAAIRRLKELK